MYTYTYVYICICSYAYNMYIYTYMHVYMYLYCHSLETSSIADFSNTYILAANITNNSKHLCLECSHTEGPPRPLYDASSVPLNVWF